MRHSIAMDAHYWIREEDRRYYKAWVTQDLFGTCVVIKCWGSLDSQRGGNMAIPVQDEEAGKALIERIGKRRLARGYRVC